MEIIDTEKYRQMLVYDFPQLNIISVKHIGTGWHHIALEVNDTIIFRVPRKLHVRDLSASLRYETEILRRLQNKLPVSIPNPQYISPENTYFGYPKLDGEILESLVDTFNEEDWTQLIEVWTDAAAVIHKTISVDDARALGVPIFDGDDTSMAKKVFDLPGIDDSILAFARKTIEQVESVNMQTQTLAFVHNDMQFHNIVADSVSKRMIGLIDWTDVCIAPVAREFATGEWIQRKMSERVISLYEQKTGVHVDPQQAIMWRAIEEISDLVEEVLGGEHEEAAKTLVRLRQLAASER